MAGKRITEELSTELSAEERKIFDEVSGGPEGRWFLVPVPKRVVKTSVVTHEFVEVPGRLLEGNSNDTASFMHSDGTRTSCGRRIGKNGKPIPIEEQFIAAESPQ